MRNLIYLDNAATTLIKPPEVTEAVAASLGAMGNPGRGVHEASLLAARTVYETREALAEFFCAESADCIAFTMNATESLNIAIRGVLNSGEHVITTQMEHNSVLRPLYMLEKQGVELTVLPCGQQGSFDISALLAAIRSNTKAFVCTHASNLTGNVNDIEKLGALMREKGILFIVDASQSAGILPIDVQKMNIDILCFTGHKGLLAPQGTGGLYVRSGIKVRPLLVGGSGIDSYNPEHPECMPAALEAGTLNVHGISGLLAALSYIRREGRQKIYEKELRLMWDFYRGIKDIPGVEIYGDFSEKYRCPIVALNISDYDPAAVSDVLDRDYGIAVRPGAHCAPLMHRALGTDKRGAVRFSFSCFNTEDEIRKAVNAVAELAE